MVCNVGYQSLWVFDTVESLLVGIKHSPGFVIGGFFLFSYVKSGPHHSDKPYYSRESIEDDPFIAASTHSLNSVDRRDRKRDSSVNYGYQPDGRELRLLANTLAPYDALFSSS